MSLKSKIIDYYDNLITEIDIYCEKLLTNPTKLDSTKLDHQRVKFVNEITKIQSFNLNELDANTPKGSLGKKLCFFIPRKTQQENSFFCDNIFGKLIVTNQNISKSLLDTLTGIYNNEIFDLEFVKLTSHDVILMSLILQLVEHRKSNFIIDLSNIDENVIEDFRIEKSSIQVLKPNDFDQVQTTINTKLLKTCYFEFFNAKSLCKNSFLGLGTTKEINLVANEHCILEPYCFDGLNKVDRLGVYKFNMRVLESNILHGLENLIRLDLSQSSLEKLTEGVFKNLKNLKYLNLFNNKIAELDKDTFVGLDCLQVLELGQNDIFKIHRDVFNPIKNITYLNLRNSVLFDLNPSCFNQLKNLEFLSLVNDRVDYNLDLEDLKFPKLKYLSLNSKEVPNFQMKLDFLHLAGVEDLDEYSLRGQPKLKGLRLDMDSKVLVKVNKKNFESLKSLVYYKIKIKNREKPSNTPEYYKSLLNCSKAYFTDSVFNLGYFQVSSDEGRFERDFILKNLEFNPVSDDAIDYYYTVNYMN